MTLPISRPSRRPRQPRPYRQEARARQTEANADGIVRAAVALVRRVPRVADITLEDVATESGLTVRTILRRFGSRDDLLNAAYERLKVELSEMRLPTPVGDVDAAVTSLVGQYEQMGDFNVRVLAQEHELPMLHRAMSYGRQQHRAWVVEAFAPQLAHLSPPAREHRVTALYAATDVYLWKLLRRDFRHDRRETELILLDLVRGVLALDTSPRKGGK